MRRVAKILGAAAVGIAGILLILSMLNNGPAQPREFRAFIAENIPPGPDGKCKDAADVLHVLPASFELNGRTLTEAEVSAELTRTLDNRVNRVVFIDGDRMAPFAQVAKAMTMLRELRIESAMLTPGLDRTKCLGVSRKNNRTNQVQHDNVQTSPWWKIW